MKIKVKVSDNTSITKEIDSKRSLYQLLMQIQEEQVSKGKPPIQTFYYNERPLEVSDLSKSLSSLYGEADLILDAFTFLYGTPQTNLSLDALSQHSKTLATIKSKPDPRIIQSKAAEDQEYKLDFFINHSGLHFFPKVLSNLIRQYSEDKNRYVVIDVIHALHKFPGTVHLGTGSDSIMGIEPKRDNLWTLVATFFKRFDLLISANNPGALQISTSKLAFDSAVNLYPLNFEEYADFESAKAACKRPHMQRYTHSLSNTEYLLDHKIILCINADRLQAIYAHTYSAQSRTDDFSENLNYIDVSNLYVTKKHWGISAQDLKASFSKFVIEKMVHGTLQYQPNLGGKAVELSVFHPSYQSAMNYFIHLKGPVVWKRSHTLNEIINKAFRENQDGPTRSSILALLEKDDSWLASNSPHQVKLAILDHFQSYAEVLSEDVESSTPSLHIY